MNDDDAAILSLPFDLDPPSETELNALAADLDEEDGFLVYDVDLRTDTEEVDVTVDAGSGAVLRIEREPLDRD